mmetsp:Transcript_26768/g.58293  ORF Transcript_26768/g.58293 Transcript_26768/m.58293 type:complete len:339 (-) Transcript_26768:599-1615(-)
MRLLAGRWVTCQLEMSRSAGNGNVITLRGGKQTADVPWARFAAHWCSTTGRFNIPGRNLHLEVVASSTSRSRLSTVCSSASRRWSRSEHSASIRSRSCCSCCSASLRSSFIASLSSRCSLRCAAASLSACFSVATISSLSRCILATSERASIASLAKCDFCCWIRCASTRACISSLSFSASRDSSRDACSSIRRAFGRMSNTRIMRSVNSAFFHRFCTFMRSSWACFQTIFRYFSISFCNFWFAVFRSATSWSAGLLTMSNCRVKSVFRTPWSSTSMGLRSETATGSRSPTNLESASTSISESAQNFLNQVSLSSFCWPGLAKLREYCSRTAGRNIRE